MAKPVAKVAVSIPADLHRAVERARKRSRQTRSAVVQEALRHWLRLQARPDLIRRYEAGSPVGAQGALIRAGAGVAAEQTTLDLDDQLLRAAEQHAATEGTTLTRVVEEALRERLTAKKRPGRPFILRLLTKKGRPIPKIDLADRTALYERMEGRD